jgi:hypothetical protein
MDLKDFIATSLCQIAEGILAASEQLKQTDAVVNPTRMMPYTDGHQAYGGTVERWRITTPPTSQGLALLNWLILTLPLQLRQPMKPRVA